MPVLTRKSHGFIVPAVLALTVLLGVVIFDRYAAHGLTASYFVTVHNKRELLYRALEHRVDQGSETRVLGHYAQHWDFRKYPVLEDAPQIDVVMKGLVELPKGPPAHITADGTGEISVRVDGSESATKHGPGKHKLEVHWRDTIVKGRRAQLRLLYGDLSGELRTFPFWAFSPEENAWTTSRVVIDALGVVLAALLAFLAGLLHKNRSGFDAPIVHGLAIVTVLSLSFGFRIYDYDVVPDFRDNGDEMFAAWNGFSLIDHGQTRGWSLWYEHYGNRVKVQNTRWLGSSEFKVITPYFEHPPLLHVLTGVAAKLGGARTWIETQHRFTRIVPIVLSVLSTLLVMAIGRSLSPKGTGPYFAGLLYATIPTIALQGRVVKEEALLTFLILLGTYFYSRFRSLGLRRDLVFAAVLMGLCAPTKVTGVVMVAVLTMWLTAERAYRDAFIAGALGLAVSSLLLLYGFVIDWNNFWFATTYQATNRPSHFNLLLRFFDDGLINQTVIGRGFLLFLWLAFVGWAARQAPSTRRVVLLPLLVYLFAIAVPSGNWTFGWYAQPLYPWLCIGAGAFIAEAFERPSLWHGTLIVAVLLMYAINFTIAPEWAKDSANWQLVRRMVTTYIACGMAPYALYEAFPKARTTLWLGRITTAIALVAFVGFSGYFVTHYDVIRYTHNDFDRLKFFDR